MLITPINHTQKNNQNIGFTAWKVPPRAEKLFMKTFPDLNLLTIEETCCGGRRHLEGGNLQLVFGLQDFLTRETQNKAKTLGKNVLFSSKEINEIKHLALHSIDPNQELLSRISKATVVTMESLKAAAEKIKSANKVIAKARASVLGKGK